MTASAIYDGSVVHQRLRPRRHHLRYRLFNLLLELEELPALSARLRLFSLDRFNLFSFHQRDHGDGQGDLRGWVLRQLAAAGVALEGGRIRVLCMPRMLGHGFNPISTYFCHHADGRLLAMLYEVNNTFGQRHSYLIPVEQETRPLRQSCDKAFHVSPFLPMALRYRFDIAAPRLSVAIAVQAADAAGPLILTRFSGRRQELTDTALLRLAARMPLLGARVLGAIHWEAAKLFAKGLRFHRSPAPPATPVTILRNEGRDS